LFLFAQVTSAGTTKANVPSELTVTTSVQDECRDESSSTLTAVDEALNDLPTTDTEPWIQQRLLADLDRQTCPGLKKSRIV